MQLEVDISSESDVTVLVSRAGRALTAAGVQDEERGRVLTVCAELGQNIAKYGRYGQVTLRIEDDARGCTLTVEASDRGPGIADVAAALRDHFSSGGTLGLGLPGVKRLMDDLQIDSAPGAGTRVRATRRLFSPRGGR